MIERMFVNSPEEAVRMAYAEGDDEISRLIKGVDTFDDVFTFMGREDSLTDSLYEKDANGLVIFPIKGKNNSAEPFHGHIWSQNSRYHAEDTVTHVRMVVSALKQAGAQDWIVVAGLLHDMGKKYTIGTNKSGEACFYGHEKVSACLAAFVLKKWHFPKEEAEKIVAAVFYHMQVHFQCGNPEAETQFEKAHGKEFAAAVKLLAACDKGIV